MTTGVSTVSAGSSCVRRYSSFDMATGNVETHIMADEKKSLNEALADRTRGTRNETTHAEQVKRAMQQVNLDDLVAQSLSVPQVSVNDFSASNIAVGVGVGSSVHKIVGTAEFDGRTVPWSIVLKLLNKLPGQEASASGFYWHREADFFRSDIAEAIHDGLRPPRRFAVVDFSADAAALWLEDIPHSDGRWTELQFNKAAWRIGLFSGTWYGRCDLITEPWMNSERGFVEAFYPLVEKSLNALQQMRHSNARRFIARSDEFIDELRQEWERRSQYMNIYGSAPTTLCHFDAHQENLIWSESDPDDLVAIDWSYTGPGALGEDLVVLVTQRTRKWKDLSPSRLPTCIESTFDSYADGLRESGCASNIDEARTGFLSLSAIFWCGKTVLLYHRSLEQEPPEDPATIKERIRSFWDANRRCESELERLKVI